METLHQVKLQTKLWVTQIRMTAKMEIRMLFCKLDNCTELAERKVLEQAKQLHELLQEKQQMHAQLCMMVSVNDKDRAKIGELNDGVCSAQEQVQNLSNSLKVCIVFEEKT